ncbi:MAG: hypothetical protein GY936_07225 [Ignavibacteriae bacterium]|nr:hypothetical protein [Ignavibacteriota bacterium]
MKNELEIKLLKLFNQKVERLEEINLLKDVKSIGFRIKFGNNIKTKAERVGPDQKTIDAYALTIRFFVIDKDGISLNKIFEIYQKLKVDPIKLEKYKTLRYGINNHFKKFVNFQKGGERFTNKYAFETILFGDLAHADYRDRKRKQFELFENNPAVFQIMYRSFTLTLVKFHNVLTQIKILNTNIIEDLI